MSTLTMGSLFDGIGGFPLAAERHGIQPAWASEIEKFPIEVTSERFPSMTHQGDITKLNGKELFPVDIICGGSPCQDLSVAGARAGLAGARSGLFMEQVRIVKEMRTAEKERGRIGTAVRPRNMIWENVPGAFSSGTPKGEDFRIVLEEIVRVCFPGVTIPRPYCGSWLSAGVIIYDGVFSLAWRCLDAQYWGVAQRRKRIFLVVDFASMAAPMSLFDMLGQDDIRSTAPAESVQHFANWGEEERLKYAPFMLLDLTPGHGDLFGEPYWEIRSAWRENGLSLNTGVAPRVPIRASLSSILEAHPDKKYYLSPTACLGILRRADERGKELPEQLKLALMAQAGLIPAWAASGAFKAYHINQRDEGIDLGGVSGALMATTNMQMQTFVTGDPTLGAAPIAFAANQRDEVRDLHDVAGALGAQPGMKQQTFVAEGCLTPWDTQQKRIFLPDGVSPTLAGADGGGGRNPGGLLLTAAFSAGAGAKAGGIGFSEQVAPTLKGSASGNCMPSVLCLNDQGGERMDLTIDQTTTLRSQAGGHQPLVLNDQGGAVMSVSEDLSGTLRAQEHGHQPLVFENHGIDARYTGPHRVAPTLSARAGTGGNNLPLVAAEPEEETPILCITGNAIDRQPKNGGNGLGIDEGIAFTLTATDRHAVFSRQRVDIFLENDVVSTESARQHKDATDLVYQETVGALTSSDRKGPNSQYVGQDKLVVDGPLLIRRLTPLECERLQGFPDLWTLILGAADSARYKALGNSVAIPCVEFLMSSISLAAELSISYVYEQVLCWLW